ncbi:MAG: precorrin-2 dehydrogenase/sirohydrochlorin ferrochelatase family protein, partial [Terriglobales bacterium]
RNGTTLDRFYYPINLNLKGERVLVCGGSRLALAEIDRLVEFGAEVDVVAPNMVSELHEIAMTYGDCVALHRRPFDQTDEAALKSGRYLLVFAYYNKEEDNKEVLKAAAQANILAFAIDDPERSNYIVPSLIKRGHLKISVSTDALSPPLERALVQRIEATFVNEIDKYTLFLNAMHERITRLLKDQNLSQPAIFRRVVRRLAESEEIFLALQRRNFEEANHLAEAIVFEIKSEFNEPATL